MDRELRECIKEDINRLMVQLLDCADRKHLCIIDEYGTKTLEGIPLKLLIFTSITCITREHMKQLLQDIEISYQRNYNQLPEIQQLWQLLYQEIKRILCIYFIEVYEDIEKGKLARIVGYIMNGTDSRRSSLPCIILLKFCYLLEEKEGAEEELKEYIGIPTVAKVVSGMEKNIRVWNENEQFKISSWGEQVLKFVSEQLDDNMESLNVVQKNIVDIKNQMRYIVGGNRDAKEIFREVLFCQEEE